ncbi:MAG: hypothetical protein NZ902_05220 [Acidilobaceae archaeon]|nr:hypothetical protein [Acidilobaceae archaeon]MCX8165967.1 hypothetical protein [Acidilobaceae archaeon]MDW7974610.1 hypothetical protein [Sulfolobales archaeon]
MGGVTLADLLRLALTALAVVLVALVAGKLLWLPIAIVGPSGGPPFLGIATYVPLGGEGPYLSCVDLLRSGCELVEDPRAEGRAYRVFLEIPLALWLLVAIGAPLTAFLAIWAWRPPIRLVLAAAALLLTVDLVAISTLYVDQARIVYQIPGVELGRVSLDMKESKAKINLTLGDYKLLSSSCEIPGLGEVNASVKGSVIEVDVPSALFDSLYSRKAAERPFLLSVPARVGDSFRISCTSQLDKGRLSGSYTVLLTWEEPTLRANGSSVIVRNPNPVKLEVTLELRDTASLQLLKRERITLQPLQELSIDVRQFGRGRVEASIFYSFLGAERGQKVELTAR